MLVADYFGDAADAGGDDGQARVSGLDQGERERLAPGGHEEEVERFHIGACIGEEPEKAHAALHAVVLRVFGKPVLQLAVADDRERRAGYLDERAYRVLDPLGRMKLGDHAEPYAVRKAERLARFFAREERRGGNPVPDHDEAPEKIRKPCEVAPDRFGDADGLVGEEGRDGVDGMEDRGVPPGAVLVESPAVRGEHDARHAREPRRKERQAALRAVHVDQVRPFFLHERKERAPGRHLRFRVDVAREAADGDRADACGPEPLGEEPFRPVGHRHFMAARRHRGRELVDVALRPAPVRFSDYIQDFHAIGWFSRVRRMPKDGAFGL